jgi:hypothetical protein
VKHVQSKHPGQKQDMENSSSSGSEDGGDYHQDCDISPCTERGAPYSDPNKDYESEDEATSPVVKNRKSLKAEPRLKRFKSSPLIPSKKTNISHAKQTVKQATN